MVSHLNMIKMPKMGLAMSALSDAFLMIFSRLPRVVVRSQSVLSVPNLAFRPKFRVSTVFGLGPKITDHKICKSRMLLN